MESRDKAPPVITLESIDVIPHAQMIKGNGVIIAPLHDFEHS
jgi:hypothetical protein